MEVQERVRELVASARDVARRHLDDELGVLVDLMARLFVTADEPGEDERLGLHARLREAALDQSTSSRFFTLPLVALNRASFIGQA